MSTDAYYDDRPARRRITPAVTSNARVEKDVRVRLQSLNKVEVGDQREPRQEHREMVLEAGDFNGTTTVELTIPTTGEFGLDDLIAALQMLKRSV